MLGMTHFYVDYMERIVKRLKTYRKTHPTLLSAVDAVLPPACRRRHCSGSRSVGKSKFNRITHQMYYGESSHANKWLLSSWAELNSLREHVNRRARDALSRADIDDRGGGGEGGGGGGCVATEDMTREGGRGVAAVVVVGDDHDGGDPPSRRRPCKVYGLDETRVARHELTDLNVDGKWGVGDASMYARPMMAELDPDYGPAQTAGGNPLLSPADKSTLVSF
jgi:hypothetical protein